MDDKPSVGKNKMCVFSKTKYYEIEKQITTIFPDQSLQMLEILKNVLEFDPNISTYNANVKASIDKRRKKLKEEGISTYISSGFKSTYYKRKDKVI